MAARPACHMADSAPAVPGATTVDSVEQMDHLELLQQCLESFQRRCLVGQNLCRLDFLTKLTMHTQESL